jgi:hypothetical protein
MHQLTKSETIRRMVDGASIQIDPANTDYQAYLKWLSEGNEPLQADQDGETK